MIGMLGLPLSVEAAVGEGSDHHGAFCWRKKNKKWMLSPCFQNKRLFLHRDDRSDLLRTIGSLQCKLRLCNDRLVYSPRWCENAEGTSKSLFFGFVVFTCGHSWVMSPIKSRIVDFSFKILTTRDSVLRYIFCFVLVLRSILVLRYNFDEVVDDVNENSHTTSLMPACLRLRFIPSVLKREEGVLRLNAMMTKAPIHSFLLATNSNTTTFCRAFYTILDC